MPREIYGARSVLLYGEPLLLREPRHFFRVPGFVASASAELGFPCCAGDCWRMPCAATTNVWMSSCVGPSNPHRAEANCRHYPSGNAAAAAASRGGRHLSESAVPIPVVPPHPLGPTSIPPAAEHCSHATTDVAWVDCGPADGDVVFQKGTFTCPNEPPLLWHLPAAPTPNIESTVSQAL